MSYVANRDRPQSSNVRNPPIDNYELGNFSSKRQREERHFYGRKPKKIADVVAQLITQRGYGRIGTDEQLTEAWQKSAGETLARFSRTGKIRRGTLEVWVAALQRELPRHQHPRTPLQSRSNQLNATIFDRITGSAGFTG